MATANHVVSVRNVFFDTDIGARIIVPVFTIDANTNELPNSDTYYVTGKSYYCSALVTGKFENGVTTYESPAFHNNGINVLNTNVYIDKSVTYPRIIIYTGTNIITIYSSSPSSTYSVVGDGFYIVETKDGDWIFLSNSIYDTMYGTDVAIPATASAFGNLEHTFNSDIMISWASSGANYLALAIGNGLKTGAIEIDPDPYREIPESTTGGAGGTYIFNQSDDIDYPSLPTLSAVSTGFISLWTPSETQMLKLAEYMWNADILTIEFWKKLFVNPLDLIYGLNLVPLDLSAISPSIIDSTQNVVMGLIDTKIAMDHLNTQWIEFDCGSITIDETWGAYLDYDPYTKLEIYLPYCGTHPLKVDDFMPGSISVKYHIDLLTGSCVAMVKSTKSNDHDDVLDSIVYQFMGNCATQVPVTAAQYSDAVRSAISIAASIGSMVAVGVGGAAAAGAAKMAGASTHIGMNTLSRELNLGASAVENVMNLKPSIERSGAIGSSGGMLAVQTPYLILTRPRQARPEYQNVYTGYPSFITETLGDLNGWTIVQAIHLDNIPCTSEELDEIDGLLKTGVIF